MQFVSQDDCRSALGETMIMWATLVQHLQACTHTSMVMLMIYCVNFLAWMSFTVAQGEQVCRMEMDSIETASTAGV